MLKGISRVMLLVGSLVFLTSASMADTLTLQNGGTVTGSFVYDATTNTVASFDFTTTAGGGFGNEIYNATAPYTAQSGAGAVVLSNQDGDQVFGFDAAQADGTVDELDIAISCGGVLNCAEMATTGNSFAVTAGLPSCPNPGTTTGYCIESGLQNDVPGGFANDPLSAGNFITITDPPSPTDTLFTFTLSTTATGTVFSGGGTGTAMPEPSSLLLLGTGLLGLVAMSTRKSRRQTLRSVV